jgi:hypothetical protein
MVRAVALLGMTGGFLAISPKLRDSVVDTFAAASVTLEEHSPYSYVIVSVVVLVGIVVILNRGSAAR